MVATETEPLLGNPSRNLPNAHERNENRARHINIKSREQDQSNDGEAASSTSGDGQVGDSETENPERPQGLKFALVFTCILMGDFLVGYDTSCVTTLTPVISNEFRAMDDVAWYGIAYILASVSTILSFGQLYSLYPNKAIFLTSFAIFALGSFISASALSSATFIVGRAISGLGSAGVFCGGTIIVANTTPLKTRPIYQSLAGGMECTALAFGPLLSGAIAHVFSWRWPFYLIVPLSLCIMASIGCFVHNLPHPEKAPLSVGERWREVDFAGTLLFVPMAVFLILALQWGGIETPWSDARIVSLLVAAALLAVAFGVVEWRRGDSAMFPLRLLKTRSMMLGCTAQTGVSAFLFVFAFYLPIYFQTLLHFSPLHSSFLYLPTAATFAASILLTGHLTSAIGYYTPPMLFGTMLMVTGAAVTTTLHPDSPRLHWILYQVPLGLGAGLSFQQTYTAVQTLLPDSDVATGLVALSFAQEIGGIIVLALSQNIFLSLLATRLPDAIPGFERSDLLEHGIEDLPLAVPKEFRGKVYEVYGQAIVSVFFVGLACACLTVCGLGIEWKSVREEKKVEGERVA